MPEWRFVELTMSLVSNLFMIFVAATVLVYYLVPARFQWIVLMIFSYLYYACGGMRYLGFLLYSTTVIYLFGRLLQHLHEKGADGKVIRRVTALGLVLNFGMLGAVKYTGFTVQTLNALFHWQIPGVAVLFPLGISFYTFQSSGYLLDVCWQRVQAEKNFFRFALFVSFFPQLLQGPIGRFDRLAPQLTGQHRPDAKRMLHALERIIWGLAKKMILADWAGVFADAIWGDTAKYNGVVLFALLFYGIQLYADFSGAIDVVLGIGQLFGITMDENFRQPYFAVSISDFWKRWHITLGQWMKDYVFYPLSLSEWMKAIGKKSRKVFGKQTGRALPIAIADLIVFFLVGVWHGADWTFIVYGLLNGAVIAFSQLMEGNYRRWKKAFRIQGNESWFHCFRVIRTFLLVQFFWFFDRSDNMAQVYLMIRNAFTHFQPAQLLQIAAGSQGQAFVPQALAIIVVSCAVMLAIGALRERGIDVKEQIASLPLPVSVGIWFLVFILIGVFGCTAAPRGFIYAQF